MGQMTHGVMLAAYMAPPDTLEEGWSSLIDEYDHGYDRGKGPAPSKASCDPHFIGFWVAVGTDGKDGLDVAFALDGFAEARAYKPALAKARKGWDKFAKWCAKRGIVLPDARLYLVMTEVA